MPGEAADDLNPEERRGRSLKGYIKLGYVALAFWPFLLLAAGMGFDSPKAAGRASTWIILRCALCFGALPFVTHFAARLASGAGRYRAANWIAVLPMTLIAALFGSVIIWAIVMDILLKLHF